MTDRVIGYVCRKGHFSFAGEADHGVCDSKAVADIVIRPRESSDEERAGEQVYSDSTVRAASDEALDDLLAALGRVYF